MCKMVFIGTDNVLEEIPYDENMPAFSLEKIGNELLPIADKFSKANIYYVATAEGCGCGLGIYKEDPERLNPYEAYTKAADIIRKAIGKDTLQESGNRDPKDTLQLIGYIESNTRKDSTTELYCCWTGAYAEPAKDEISMDLSTHDLREVFAIEEDQKITFYRS